MPPDSPSDPRPPLSFRGGLFGTLAPLGLFLVGVSWLGLSGAPDERGFWPVLLGAQLLGLILVRDRHAYADALLAGMSRPLVMVMVLAWLLAGVLGTLIRESGLVEALVWSADAAGVSGGAYVAASFIVAALFSTVTGTSLGTLLVCAPLLYPPGPALGADPAWLLGAILGGATFGDNISPISDTTIASAGTQGADVSGVVRTRARYALPVAGVTLLLSLLLGGSSDIGSTTALPGSEAVAPAAFAMLVVPAVVLVLLLRREGLIPSLLYGILAAVTVGLLTGGFTPSDLMRVDHDQFLATGLLLDGMTRAVGISIFTILIMGLVGAVEAAGLLDRIVASVGRRARGATSAEWWIVGTTSAAVLLTTHSAVAILAVGDVARETGSAFGVNRYRRANLMDLTVCTWPFLFPFFIPTILAAALTGGVEGAPRLSAWTAGLHNIHSWGLLAMVVLAVATGWGRAARPSPPESVR